MPASPSPSGKSSTVCEENQEGQGQLSRLWGRKVSHREEGPLSARRASSGVVAHLILVAAHEDDGL